MHNKENIEIASYKQRIETDQMDKSPLKTLSRHTQHWIGKKDFSYHQINERFMVELVKYKLCNNTHNIHLTCN